MNHLVRTRSEIGHQTPDVGRTIILAAIAYFGLVNYFATIFFGADVASIPYFSDHLLQFSYIWFPLTLNLIFLVGFLSLNWFSIRKKPAAQTTIISRKNWWLISIVNATFIGIILLGIGLTREEAKDLLPWQATILLPVPLAYAASLIVTTKDRSLLVAQCAILFLFAGALFERETLLFPTLAIALRLGNRRAFKTLFVVGAIGVFILIAFKLILLSLKFGYDQGSFSVYSPLRLLIVDGLPKMHLELSFFSGEYTPRYSALDAIFPLQFRELFYFDQNTNARLATMYYTGNIMGTGFSPIIEGYLLGGIFGVLLSGMLFGAGYRLVRGSGSEFLMIPFLVFSIKYVRSEFWPPFIFYFVAPLFFYSVVVVVRNALVKR